MKALVLAFLMVYVMSAQDVEKQLKRTAHFAEFGVLPVWYHDPANTAGWGVVGTGFLVTSDGYFITAAHVLEHYKPKSAQMTVGLRQRSGDMSGLWFDVVEKDDVHDLALCKVTLPRPKFIPEPKNPGTEQPIASLHISEAKPVTGQFIAIAGFPLGSWIPAIQFGTLAATNTTNPNAGRVAAGQRELFQIGASGNMGNSGSPVIELDTGDVIGVVVQAQPAPLFSSIQGVPLAQSSGIMLAVPASWVRDLLKRHSVLSSAHPPPQGHTSYYPLPSN
jgi:serine protease Do